MYQMLGDTVYDSEEIEKMIESSTSFTVKEDMTKRTKREDALAYKLAIKAEKLDADAGEYIEDEDKINLLMEKSDELLKRELENLKIEYTITQSYSYTYDEVTNEILSVMAVMHIQNGRRKLPDVIKRLLSQV